MQTHTVCCSLFVLQTSGSCVKPSCFKVMDVQIKFNLSLSKLISWINQSAQKIFY